MGSETPLVSAVIPVYNGERFLMETIESVLLQTYVNIECIIVDDGSTDRTAEIARGFRDKIKYVAKPNGGVSSARNLGIRSAKGELIAFLDADDLWFRNKIEKQVTEYGKNPDIGLIYTSLVVGDEHGKPLFENRYPAEYDPLRDILLLKTPVFLPITGMVPVKVFDEVGYFDEELSTSADADMACRIALKYSTRQIAEPLALYRQHGGQMHLNLSALEADMTRVYEKIFATPDLPPRIASIRSKCYSALDLTLAAAYFKRDRGKALSYLVKAFRHDFLYAVARSAEMLKSRMASQK